MTNGNPELSSLSMNFCQNPLRTPTMVHISPNFRGDERSDFLDHPHTISRCISSDLNCLSRLQYMRNMRCMLLLLAWFQFVAARGNDAEISVNELDLVLSSRDHSELSPMRTVNNTELWYCWQHAVLKRSYLRDYNLSMELGTAHVLVWNFGAQRHLTRWALIMEKSSS
jgi:hypothetical protein